MTDITYIRTWQGWLSLAVVMDLFSHKVIGCAVAPTIRRELVPDAVLKAVRTEASARHPYPFRPRLAIWQRFTWRRFCRTNRLEPSMSHKGNCWDNAVVEAFFASLRKERIKKQIYKNRDLATADVTNYIAFYNRTRRHSHLGGISPEEYEGSPHQLTVRLSTIAWELQGGCEVPHQAFLLTLGNGTFTEDESDLPRRWQITRLRLGRGRAVGVG